MSKKAGTKDAAAPQSATNPTPQKELYPMVNWKYDMFLYTVGNIVDMFFREVVPRGAWRVPQTGPVLFVAAPHANQVSCSSKQFLLLERILVEETKQHFRDLTLDSIS